jgi:hypothetical protein
MPEYRIFLLDDAGRIAGASAVIVCETDEQAVAETKALSLGPKVEVWQGSRMVVVLTAIA